MTAQGVVLRTARRFGVLGVLGLLLSLSAIAADKAAAPASLRLYVMDCGRIDVTDMGWFSDTGEYDGKAGTMSVPCFLIRHPKGDLLWDAGLGDELVALPDGRQPYPQIHESAKTALAEQLQRIGLSVDQIDFFAFSHAHADHTGNANALRHATWIVNRKELDGLATTPGVRPELLSAREQAKLKLIDGDDDVFGDGSVMLLRTPGHTPGHQVLQLKLRKAGPLILAGDLYHTRDNYKFRRVPRINVSRADTLASFDRIDRIVRNTRALVIVQHAPEDIASLPGFPAYLD